VRADVYDVINVNKPVPESRANAYLAQEPLRTRVDPPGGPCLARKPLRYTSRSGRYRGSAKIARNADHSTTPCRRRGVG